METNSTGSRIVKARKEKNMSQAQLAEQLFISPQAVGKWERGESVPDINTVVKLAEVLGVDLNYFSGRSPSTGPDGNAATAPRPAEAPSTKPGRKRGWDMSRSRWMDADFSGLKGLHEKFNASDLRNCTFVGSDLSGLLLQSNEVKGCDFRSSAFDGSRISSSDLENDQFNDCTMRKTEFSKSSIKGCDFSGADLTGAAVRLCDLRKNTVVNAVLNGAGFHFTEIADTVFEGTVEDCSFENCNFSKVVFRNVTFRNTFFKGNRFKQTRFIDCQADRISYEFLRSGKAEVGDIIVLASE